MWIASLDHLDASDHACAKALHHWNLMDFPLVADDVAVVVVVADEVAVVVV